MADHVKPTAEELQKNIDKTIEEIDKEVEEFVSPSLPPEEEEKEEPIEEIENEEKKSDVETPEEKEEEPEPKEEIKEEEEVDKKLADQRREALILNARQNKMNDAINELDSLPEPTEEELQKEALVKGFSYDEMTGVEKALFKTSIHNERKLQKISTVAKEGKDINDWYEKVDNFLADPETLHNFPALDGRENDFKIFTAKSSRRGVDFETLVLAFTSYAQNNKPVTKKGQMFETGTGGDKTRKVVKDSKLTVEQGRALMQTDYKKYKELLKQGKIANE